MARGARTDDAGVTTRGRLAAALAGAALLVAVAGCGSATVAELPPAAGPDRSPPLTATPAGTVDDAGTDPVGSIPSGAPATAPSGGDPLRSTLRDGSLEAVLDPKARELRIVDTATGAERSRTAVGVGPTHVICAPEGPCFVVDTQGDALLVLRVGEGGTDLRLTRRVYVAGAPYGIALDPERRRLWVTLTARNELVELGAHGRPHILQRLPTIRQPDQVDVDPTSGDVTVAAPGGERRRIVDPASPAS